MTDYLDVVEVLAIHEDQIVRFGGSFGIRDMGLLQAALPSPRTGYYKDSVEQAAALWESLSQNHPFVDGNKRTAFAATYTFLAINNVVIDAKALATWRFIDTAYQNNAFDFGNLVAWLKLHAKPRRGP